MNKKSLTRNYIRMFAFIVVGVLINALLSNLIMQTELSQSAFLNLILSMLSFVLSFFFSLFAQIIAIHAYRTNSSITMDSFKSAFAQVDWGLAFWINFKVGLFVALGTMFFVIPGIYLSLSYAFVGYIVYDFKGKNDAPSRSWTLTQGFKLNIFSAYMIGYASIAIIAILVEMTTHNMALGKAIENIGSFMIQPLFINYFLNLYISALDKHKMSINENIHGDDTVIIDV